MKTESSRPDTPEALAGCRDWWPWLTDPALRLKAAIAYRAWPNQNPDRVARGERYVAAAKAIGASDREAEYFRHYRFTLEEARNRVAREDWEEQLRLDRQRRLEEYWGTPQGRRELAAKARAKKKQAIRDLQQVRQVWNTLTDTSFWTTATASWGLFDTPAAPVLVAFDAGTVGDFSDDLKLLTTRKQARKALARDFVKHAGRLRFSAISKARGMWNFGKQTATGTTPTEEQCLAYAEKRFVSWARKALA